MADESESGMSEYELQRLEHIRRNQECLERLGLADGSFMALLNPMAGAVSSIEGSGACLQLAALAAAASWLALVQRWTAGGFDGQNSLSFWM